MRRHLFITILSLLVIGLAAPGFCAATATISGSEFKAGDMVTIEGTIDPGQELYLTISMQDMFAPNQTDGAHETKRLAKDAEKQKFGLDTEIPPLYYLLTSNPDAFGETESAQQW